MSQPSESAESAASPQRQRLQALLRELFQFDSADLDFGFYAVMKQQHKQIARFIERDLLGAIDAGVSILEAGAAEEAQQKLAEAHKKVIEAYGEDAFEPAKWEMFKTLPHGKNYLAAKRAADNAGASADLKISIFNDLYQFFARYYQDGDFIAQRRYGRHNKYAIPYSGEEVYLYWANFDQYYVKSATHFTNYSFVLPRTVDLPGGAGVQVRITKVDIARDNVKGDKRFFVLAPDQPVAWDAAQQTLTVPVEYRPLTEEENKRLGTRGQQEKLLQEAHDAVLKAVEQGSLRTLLAEPDPQRPDAGSRLAYHLNRYAAENTRDFFVHKDLGGFLRRELDFYLKSEIVNLDDIDLRDQDALTRAGARTQTVRLIAHKIIAFLDQLESFQRRLFLKRKFVLQSDYCLTLDKLPEAVRASFYPQILANPRQAAEWQALYGLTVSTAADLDGHPHVMVDTAFFDAAFKYRLLAAVGNLDEALDGLLVHGDNFQALSLLSARYQSKIDCIYIDPPYNVGPSEILYKNGYKDATWLSLMANRLQLARRLLGSRAPLIIAIDDFEMVHLSELVDQMFQEYTREMVVVNHHPQGSGGANVSRTHEYSLLILPDTKNMLKGETVEDGVEFRPFMRSGTGDNNFRYGRPKSFYALLVDPETLLVKGAEQYPVQDSPYPTEPTEDGLLRVYPVSRDGRERVWRKSYESGRKAAEAGKIICRRTDERITVYEVLTHTGRRSPVYSNWTDKRYNAGTYGTNLISDLFGDALFFSYPKSLYTVLDSVIYATHNNDEATILDFFAGSGTTAHAVMNLNQQDEDSRRKYILVEMGDYFDTVLKPRIQKVAYAAEWKDGKPVMPKNGQGQLLPSGQPHMFQYIRLESYDDTFHNIRFRTSDEEQMQMLDQMPDYFLTYLLDHGTAGSPALLDVEAFARPFDYQLRVTGPGGVLAPQAVDLVASFNFLLGLAVESIAAFTWEEQARRYVRVLGRSPEGKRVCVLWRDAPPPDELEAERAWAAAHALAGVEYDKLYVNGEALIAGALVLEPEFKRLMAEGVA